MGNANPAKPLGWGQRHALLLVAVAPVLAQLIGSAFNIWYNLTHVRPLLTGQQYLRLMHTIMTFNAVVYPTVVAGWLTVVCSLRRPMRRFRRRRPPSRADACGFTRGARHTDYPLAARANRLPGSCRTRPLSCSGTSVAAI